MGNLLNTLYVKMLSARENDLARKREDMKNEDAKLQKAQQFALDISRHVEDTKQKEFWRKSQVAGQEGRATGELGQSAPEGYDDPAVQEYANVGNLSGQADANKLKSQNDYRQILEQLRIGGRAGIEESKHGYRTDENVQKGDIRMGLQNDQQQYGAEQGDLNRASRERNARTMAGAQRSRAVADQSFKQKASTADLYLGIMKSGGQMAQMTEPERMRFLEQQMQEANADAQDPSITPEMMAKKWRAKASGGGAAPPQPGRAPVTSGEVTDFSQLE